MTNKIIIDAWNVCWKIPEIASLIPDNLEQARRQFNQLLKIYFHGKSVKYKIIYDGQPGIFSSNAEFRGQDIHFSKNPESADQKIINFISSQQKAAQWTVITSDRDLANKVRNHGTKVISAENFIKKINKRIPEPPLNPKKENPNISRDEIDYWLDLFNNKDSS